MPGSPWLWIVLAFLVAVVAAGRAFYARFRGMCRSVREDLTALLSEEHPEAKVMREERGDLVVQLPDGEERVWEMAEVYAAVARLPGMGRERSARNGIYRNAVASLLAPRPGSGPLSLATHGEWIKPQLAPVSALASAPATVHTPLGETGLAAMYLLDIPGGRRALTEEDLTALGVDRDGLHRLALDNLRASFPTEMVATALAGEGSAVHLHDSYDAARLLLVPELLEEGQELVALAPHQGMLVLLPQDAADDPEKLREGMRMLECEGPALLDRPLRVTRTGLQLL